VTTRRKTKSIVNSDLHRRALVTGHAGFIGGRPRALAAEVSPPALPLVALTILAVTFADSPQCLDHMINLGVADIDGKRQPEHNFSELLGYRQRIAREPPIRRLRMTSRAPPTTSRDPGPSKLSASLFRASAGFNIAVT
jgi:hypothetical protein